MNRIVKSLLCISLVMLCVAQLSCQSKPNNANQQTNQSQDNSNQAFDNHADAQPSATVEESQPQIPAKMSLEEAKEKEDVTIIVSGVDVQEMTVEVTCPYQTTIVIDAGTLFSSQSGDTQNMIAAKSVSLSFQEAKIDSPPQVKTVKIPVYCINRFLDAPTESSGFQVSNMPETDPLRKLSACLSKEGAKHEVRQLAIWLVSDKFLDMTQEQVRAKLRSAADHKLEKITQEEIIASIREGFPGSSSAEIEQMLKNLDQAEVRDILRTEMYKDVEAEIDSYRIEARPLLEKCGFNLSTSKFFAA